jgi:prepilin-type N-terminal cleavage/methylation domain-containing protein
MLFFTGHAKYSASRKSGKQSGFTLIELSIVLVVLGLLTGGVMAGQHLIHAAELRSVGKEYETFNTAVFMFRDKYFALPGDMTNATDFWGDNTALCDDGDASNNGDPGTCNGDGDGEVRQDSSPSEGYMFWQQLSLAGLIPGTYTGTAPGPVHDLIGENVPASAIEPGGWNIEDEQLIGSNCNNCFDIPYSQVMLELGTRPSWGGDTDHELLVPIDAWKIDKKIDDGKPAHGRVISKYGFGANGCADGTSDSDLDAEYRVDVDEVRCSFVFQLRR